MEGQGLLANALNDSSSIFLRFSVPPLLPVSAVPDRKQNSTLLILSAGFPLGKQMPNPSIISADSVHQQPEAPCPHEGVPYFQEKA